VQGQEGVDLRGPRGGGGRPGEAQAGDREDGRDRDQQGDGACDGACGTAGDAQGAVLSVLERGSSIAEGEAASDPAAAG
jgi:hypothetical protein